MITGLVMGAITSRINRVKVFAISLMLGGFSQIVSGMVPNFGVLAGMRVLHGATNSVSNPLTYSLVADFVPPEKRATANSILSTAVYAGISLSSLSILLIK
jgi:predicted MFS family arabinose efflux permease